MIEFKMPSLGADMDSGTLVLWHVKPGDAVKRGDVIADVETDKGVIEVEVWDAGVVSDILIEPGRKVAVGTAMALLDGASTEAQKPSQSLEALGPEASALPPASKTVPLIPISPAGQARLRVSPLARKRAVELGIDLARVHGSGPYGEITRADVEAAPEPSAPISSPAVEKSAAMRHAMAQSMARSKRDIPHYYLQTDINMQNALQWLEAKNQNLSLENRILPAALYIKAVARACLKVPEMNGFWINGSFQASAAVHIGVAISLRNGGLIAPAIHHADSLSLPDLMRSMLDLVARARAGKLRSSEISDPTITITNLGDQGVETVFGIIYPPQVALLGFGRQSQRPWAYQQMLGIAPIVSLTLAADHRASDGHRGAIFMNHIRCSLEVAQSLEDMSNGS